MALLEVTGISKNFGSTHVLQNISLNLCLLYTSDAADE